MKFTLKDYQDEAVKSVLLNLRKANRRWHEEGDKHAFSLTATTGAGKTVMAAAVFEALFYGNEDYEFEPDNGAVVIWLSDDPSLNEQSRFRLLEASDKLTMSDLIAVDNAFARETFEPGKIYFINTQKLSKNSLLVRGHESSDRALETPYGQQIMPDLRSHSIWDTIHNTILDDTLTLYLVLDEAHRGMKEPGPRDNKPTIVKQLINGNGRVPGIPIVWGISATVERFNDAIKGMEGRATLPNVTVAARRVQESGLLKDTINLDVPDEEGDFSTVLLRRATVKLREVSDAWRKYAAEQSDADIVVPLMILQVPNAPDPNELGRWIQTIFDTWPELSPDTVYNVFGEHRTEKFGRYSAPYIAPERVQDSPWVQILVAKDAISTGWDCPRAEVMVSFRPAIDKTHITQLLGRMVRTPLARRIPGNERLNAVDCLLPYFNKNSVEMVVSALMTGNDINDVLPGRRVLVNPSELRPNPAIPLAVWEKLVTLPSQTLPKTQTRPLKRLMALAHELAADGILPDAGKTASAKLHRLLDGARVTYENEVAAARSSIVTIEGTTLSAKLATGKVAINEFVEIADYKVIEDAFRKASRVLSSDLAKSYSDYVANRLQLDDIEEALIEARTIIAAMGLVPEITSLVESEAEKLAEQWLTELRISIKSLNDARQDVYRQLSELSAAPLDFSLARPEAWLQPTVVRDASGVDSPLQKFEKHLLCDPEGMFPLLIDASWEATVLQAELRRDNCLGWYRNPPRSSQDSLGILYQEGGENKILRPDFLFFYLQKDGSISADIVDPHGHHLADALSKLRGLAHYAERQSKIFRRIESVTKIGENFRVLDLTRSALRDAIYAASSALEVYESNFANDFVI